MTYLSFLRKLLALGPTLPHVFALLQHIVADVQELIDLLGLSPADIADSLNAGGTFSAGPDDANEVASVEQEVDAAFSAATPPETYGADGRFLDSLRVLFQFLQSSGLLQIIMALLAKQ